MKLLTSILVAVVVCFGVHAQTNVVRDLGNGIYEIGKVRIDKAQRTATFPAVINMTNGLLEYLIVTDYGKRHESLLRTEASPTHVHLAMLLLDIGNFTNTVSEQPPEQTANPSAQPVPGKKVSIEISWEEKSKTIRHRAEDLIYNEQTKTNLIAAPWVYNGSRIWEGHFLAQMEGSIVSLVSDLSALVNNNAPGHNNDQIWSPAPHLPATNTAVTVTLQAHTK